MWSKTIAEFAVLFGFAALLALIINTLKFITIKGKPIIDDGNAQKWSLVGNLLGLLALYIFRLLRPDAPIAGVDLVLQEIATIGTYILTIVSQLFVTKTTNSIVRGLPMIGKSFSLEAENRAVKMSM